MYQNLSVFHSGESQHVDANWLKTVASGSGWECRNYERCFACSLCTESRYTATRGEGCSYTHLKITSLLESCRTCECKLHRLSEPGKPGSHPSSGNHKYWVTRLYPSSFQRDASGLVLSLEWARGRRQDEGLLGTCFGEDHSQPLNMC